MPSGRVPELGGAVATGWHVSASGEQHRGGGDGERTGPLVSGVGARGASSEVGDGVRRRPLVSMRRRWSGWGDGEWVAAG